ncbi:Na+/H+ antiporter NhaA [Actinomadura hibisca]|uniref:Na+/H+ antiporter NhaA n=1 Tax=Actinomadura hibisca TaxID=68565 RepID=UPI0008352658|nr:Na+/H+ antiporter NhaA [Actinomadura hibisca]
MTERSHAPRVVPEGLRAFLATETGSTSVLLVATLAGLVWANSPWGDTYDTFWHTTLAVEFGARSFDLDLEHWVNDGLMALFFFVVGLEIWREIKVGQLRDRRLVAVPLVAALGGMALPALIYYVINAGGPGASGWGIPMASDTAFVLGLLAVLGARCPAPLRVFLLTLAVADDVGAILVVAVFYTEKLNWTALLIALLLIALIVAMRWIRLWRGPAYVVLGFGLWVATVESGIHPTLAGLLLGITVAVYAPKDRQLLEAGEAVQALTRDPTPEQAREVQRSVQQAVSVNDRLQLLLHPWTSYVIVPVFAVANAGVQLDGATLRAAASSPVTHGVVLGLVVGKFVGITAGTWLPLRLKWGELPGNLQWGQVLGGAATSGIGFTVSLFITGLAFRDDPALQSQAKIGILTGSTVSALLGWLIFRLAWNKGGACAPPDAERSDSPPEPMPPITAADHTRGPADAPVTLVEYGDYECPYCGQAEEILHELRSRYGDRLRVVFRHFPLREIHPHAFPAALVAEDAADAGKFWEMHEVLFANQLALTDADLTRYAEEMGVRPWGDVPGHLARVDGVRDGGARAGVEGTPTFFVNGVLHEGSYDVESLGEAVEAALRAAPEPHPGNDGFSGQCEIRRNE